MENYAKMYAILCHAASQALDVMPVVMENHEARVILAQALVAAEELYLGQENT